MQHGLVIYSLQVATADCSKGDVETSAWVGGSILSELDGFDNIAMTKEAYDETGPALVHRQCT